MRWIPPLLVAALATGCSEYDLRGQNDGVGSPAGWDFDTLVPETPADDEEVPDTTTPPEDFVSCEDVGLWTEQWWGSLPFGYEDDPVDGLGRPFYGWDYDMIDYSTVLIPDEGHVPPGTDRVYRTHLWLDATGPRVFLDLQSDDGLWVWLNGQFLGHWGGDWQEEGCVNDDANCSEFVNIPPVEITSDVLVGDNLLAVRLSNAVVGAYMGLNARCAE